MGPPSAPSCVWKQLSEEVTALEAPAMQRKVVRPHGPIANISALAFDVLRPEVEALPSAINCNHKQGACSPNGPRKPVGDNKSGGYSNQRTALNIVKALSVGLKDTYRKIDPSRPEAADKAPRRVLTHPAFPVGNG